MNRGAAQLKIDKEIYRFIEYELFHYDEYKKELALERERILESSGGVLDGMPRGNTLSDTTHNKAMELVAGTAVLSLERRIGAVEHALDKLSDIHKAMFKKIYCQGRRDIYSMCDELHVSERTFKRYKYHIIGNVGSELGIISWHKVGTF